MTRLLLTIRLWWPRVVALGKLIGIESWGTVWDIVRGVGWLGLGAVLLALLAGAIALAAGYEIPVTWLAEIAGAIP